MNMLLVGLGAALGAMARFFINRFFEKRPHPYPWATQIINLTGAFLLGVFSGLHLSDAAYLFLGTGMMGGYTTFSTFNFELLTLWQAKPKLFYRYFAISYGGGLFLSFLGVFVGSLGQ